MSRIGVVFAHGGAGEADLFAQSIARCRDTMALHVVGVYGPAAAGTLQVEDECLRVTNWHSLSAAWNCGILHALQAGVDRILVVNDDTAFTPAAVERLNGYLEAGSLCACPALPEMTALYPYFHPYFPDGAAEAFASTQTAFKQGTFAAAGKALTRWYEPWGGLEAFTDWMCSANAGKTHRPYFQGPAFLAHERMFAEVGLFDLQFQPAYHQDVDYSRRIAALQLDAVLAFDAYFHHWGGATTRRRSGWEPIFAQNEARLDRNANRGLYSIGPARVRVPGGAPSDHGARDRRVGADVVGGSSELANGQVQRRLVIQRKNSIGDVIAASCVATHLRRLDPGLRVTFAVNPGPCREVLEHHPDIDRLIDPDSEPVDILLDGAYEQSPRFHTDHIYRFFLEAANLESSRNVRPRLGLLPHEVIAAREELSAYPRPWVVVGLRSAAASERSVPDAVWEAVAEELRDECTLFAAGGPTEKPVRGMVDWVDRFTMRQFMALVSHADLVVTSESGPLHIAQACGRPLVVVGMATNPDLRALPQTDYTGVSRGLECQFCSCACRFDAARPPCGELDPGVLVGAVRSKLEAYRGNRISALIPTYRTDPRRLAQCVERVRVQVDEVIIGIDGAGEGVLPVAPAGCALVQSRSRLGYGKLINQLARRSSGRYLLLLNDDLLLAPDAVSRLRTASGPSTAVVGGLWRYPDGTIQHGGMRWNSTLEAFDHIDRGGEEASIRECRSMGCVTFAGALIPREVFYRLGAMDEDYDTYWEDVDFCARATAAGLDVVYEPAATGVHQEAQTTARLDPAERAAMWEHGKSLYLSKWRGVSR